MMRNQCPVLEDDRSAFAREVERPMASTELSSAPNMSMQCESVELAPGKPRRVAANGMWRTLS